MATRLVSAFVLFGLLVLGSAVAGLVVAARSSSATTDVTDSLLPLQRANADMRAAVTDAEAHLRGYGETGDGAALQDFTTRWAAYPDALRRARQSCSVDARACRLVEDQATWALRWYDEYARPLADTPPGQVRRTVAQATERYGASHPLLNQARARDDALSSVIGDLTTAAGDAAHDRQRTGFWLLGVSAFLAVLFALVLARETLRAVVPPLRRLRDVLGRLASGDLDARATVQGPQEVRAVARSVNSLAAQSLRLRDAEAVRAQVRQLTRDLDRRMRQHLHGDAVADEVVHGLGPMVQADRVHVRRLDDGRMGQVIAQWSTPGMRELPTQAPRATHALESANALAARGPQALVVPDVSLHPATREMHDDPLLEQVGSIVVAPVVVGAERIGVIVCARRTGRAGFSAAEGALVESIAADMGRSMHHAALFQQQSSIVGQLRELDRTKSDFLSTISHELRTPLTSIAGYVEMLRDGDAGELAPRQDQMLEVVGRNTQRLRDLIEDVLLISRVESDAVRSERTRVDVASLVDHVVTALRPQAEAAGVRLDVVPAQQRADLVGDASQIERMLLNLVGNAVKFTPRGGRVGVSLEVTPAEVVVRVEDTGIGIPSGEVASLFSRFFRASNATSRQVPGTGLGLAIVAGIAAAHDGRVDVDSVEGRGTTFTVVLPRNGDTD